MRRVARYDPAAMKERRRDRFFTWWSGVVTRHAWTILFVAGALTAVSVGVAVKKWKFQSDRNLLISPSLDWNRRFMEIQKHFPGAHDQIVVVDAGPGATVEGSAERKAAIAFVDELGERLRKSALVQEVVYGAKFGPRALRLAPMTTFKARLEQVAQSGPMLNSPTPEALLDAISREMLASRGGGKPIDEVKISAQVRELNSLIAAMGTVLETPPDKAVNFGELVAPGESASAWQYLTSENGRLFFIKVTPRLDREALDALTPALAAIRSEVDQVAARHKGVEAGITGIEVLEAEETEAATWDSTWTSALAAVVITVVLITAFHGWRAPTFVMIALLCGIAWTYGFLFIAVGHLQVLSVVFNLMLLGLAIGYGIYMAAAFELQRHAHADTLDGFQETLNHTLRIMGPGIVTGAVTTAAAFGTTVFTDFTGVAEMGVIAGVGVMLCLIAMLTVFPSLLRVLHWRHGHTAPMESRRVYFFNERWPLLFVRHPALTLTIAGLLTAASLAAIFTMKFDYDLLKLQPRSAESVKWQHRIVDDGKQSIWAAMSVAPTMEEARARAEKFRRLPTVGGLGGVGLLFPADDAEKTALLVHTRESLGEALHEAASPPVTTAPAEPSRGGDLFAKLAGFRTLLRLSSISGVPAGVKPALDELAATLDRIGALGQKLAPDLRQARLERLRTVYADWRRDSATQIVALTDPSPLKFDDLPAEILGAYRDDRGYYALEVLPKLPDDNSIRSPLDPRFLPRFVDNLKSVDPDVSGVIVQIFYSGRLISSAYTRAGIIAFFLVFATVYLDFRRWHDSLLILVPVAMAFAMTFGLMWLCGMQVNPANIIVLPLMFGIGVDTGVHVMNRYRQHPLDQPVGLTRGTGKGITITCLTSVIGFAAMMLGDHRGIVSLGFVLATGLTMTMLACWIVMPAWLQLRNRALGIDTPPDAPRLG